MDTVEFAAVPARCAAAAQADITPCEGPGNAVLVVETSPAADWPHAPWHEELSACVHHGARVLASMIAGKVLPGVGDDPRWRDGAPVEVYLRAKQLPGFVWLRSSDLPGPARQQQSDGDVAAS